MSGDDRQNSPSISRQNRPSATLRIVSKSDLRKNQQLIIKVITTILIVCVIAFVLFIDAIAFGIIGPVQD